MSVRVAVATTAVLLSAAIAVPGRAAAWSGRVFMAPGRASADPAALAPRYAGKGWTGIAQAAATSVGSDLDSDPSTVDSSRAGLTIPAGAVVEWAGLHWGGDQAARTDGAAPHCAGTAEPATPPSLEQSGNVEVSIGDSPYQTVSAAAVTATTTASGAPGYQAFADITALLRPYAGPATVAVTVANVQFAAGPGCTGGWNVLLVYAFRNGPDRTYAPAYQSITVFDAILPTGGAATLTGLTTPAVAPVGAGVTTALLTAGAPVGVTVNGSPVAATAGAYGASAALLALDAGATGATLGVTGGGDSFAAVVLAVTVVLPVKVHLPVTATFSPADIPVGAVTQLTLTVTNDADIPDAGVAVSDPLPATMSIVHSDPAYDASTGVWTVGTIGAHATATITLTVRVDAAGSYTSSAQVTASAVDQSAAPVPAVATIVAETIAQPPTDNPDGTQAAAVQPPEGSLWLPAPGLLLGLGMFGLGLLLFLVVLVRRRAAGS